MICGGLPTSRVMAESESPPPLAAAAQLLRGRSGRPRTRPEPSATPRRRPGRPRRGSVNPGPVPRAAAPNVAMGRAVASTVAGSVALPCPPRLLGLKDAGRYLGLSRWSLEELQRAGRLREVRAPFRKLQFDRQDLDCLADQWKAGNTDSDVALDGASSRRSIRGHGCMRCRRVDRSPRFRGPRNRHRSPSARLRHASANATTTAIGNISLPQIVR